jgi:hypothetical protein
LRFWLEQRDVFRTLDSKLGIQLLFDLSCFRIHWDVRVVILQRVGVAEIVLLIVHSSNNTVNFNHRIANEYIRPNFFNQKSFFCGKLGKSSLFSAILLNIINEKHAYIRKSTVECQLLGLTYTQNTQYLSTVPFYTFVTISGSALFPTFGVIPLTTSAATLANALDSLSY